MNVRIIEIPTARIATSGPADTPDPFSDDGVLRRFDRWFTPRGRSLELAPRDLMWVDPATGHLTWNYLLEPDEDGSPWDVVTFPGGLYASAVSRDGNDANGEQVFAEMRQWVDDSPLIADETDTRPVAFHVVTPQIVADALGYHQLEILLPVRVP